MKLQESEEYLNGGGGGGGGQRTERTAGKEEDPVQWIEGGRCNAIQVTRESGSLRASESVFSLTLLMTIMQNLWNRRLRGGERERERGISLSSFYRCKCQGHGDTTITHHGWQICRIQNQKLRILITRYKRFVLKQILM